MDKVLELLAELFIRGIWESALFLFGTLLFANAKIPLKKYLFCSFAFAVFVLFVRELPISYGIHTMIILICLNLVAILLFSVNLEQSIKSTVIVTCTLFALEGLNGMILQHILGEEAFKDIINNPINTLLYFIPSSIMFGLLNLIAYIILKKKRKVQTNVGAVKQPDSE
jgi:hypothetical protein